MPKIENTFSIPPFPAFPSASRYVPVGSVEETLGRVGRSIEACESIALVMGPPGTGKSLICQMIRQRYQSSHEVVLLGDTPVDDRSALLRHLLHHLGVDHVAGPANDLHLALVDQVCGKDAKPGGLLIVVDEAQSLAADVLEAIRMTTNIMSDGQPRVTAIVCGGVKLEETLVSSTLEPFNQRVATRCYLHPMSADETRDYIHSIISQCGAEPETTITSEAVAAIHHGCDGVPRLVNQLMTQAIDAAEEISREVIDESIVDRAWATLQQLPSPMLEPPAMGTPGQSVSSESAIEFGELEPLGTSVSPGTTEESADDQPESCHTCADSEIDTSSKLSITSCDQSCAENVGSADEDIVIESASASWIEESQTPSNEEIALIPASAPPATALFGEFEYEEEVQLGEPVALPAIAERSAESQSMETSTAHPTEQADQQAVEAPAQPEVPSGSSETIVAGSSLESVLHQEIIGLTSYDETVMVLPENDSLSETGDAVIESLGSDEVVEPEDSSSEVIESSHDDPPNEDDAAEVNGPALRFVAQAAERPAEVTFESRPAHDDSDLLVYEEDFDRHSEPAGLSETNSEDTADDSPVAIDFQSMLSRMRTGT